MIEKPGHIYALCPHCKKENVELIVKFMMQSETVNCKCGVSFTTEMLNLPGPNGSTQTITNVSPLLKEQKNNSEILIKKIIGKKGD